MNFFRMFYTDKWSAPKIVEKFLHVHPSLNRSPSAMSTVVPLDKLNVFSFAAGFFFLTAAALSAYLIYQEEEEQPDFAPQTAAVRSVRSRTKCRATEEESEAQECYEETSAQESDLLEGSSLADSDLEEEQDATRGSFAPKIGLPKDVFLQVQDPCTFSDDSENFEDDSTEEEEEGVSLHEDEDMQSPSGSQEDSLDDFLVGARGDRQLEEDKASFIKECEDEDEISRATSQSAFPPAAVRDLVPAVLQSELSPDDNLDATALMEPGTSGVAENEGNPEQGDEDYSEEFQQSDLTKLYKMEEDVKISRFKNPKIEDDEKSTSYLHYNKVTTIGVFGSSPEKDDLEELLKNRTFQGSYSEWIPPDFFAEGPTVEEADSTKNEDDKREMFLVQPSIQDGKEKFKAIKEEKPLPSARKVQEDSDDLEILDDLDDLLEAVISPGEVLPGESRFQFETEGEGDQCIITEFEKGDQFLTTNMNSPGEDRAVSPTHDIPLEETSACLDFLSRKDSPILTQWYAWEKEILGDTFLLEPSGEKETPRFQKSHSFIDTTNTHNSSHKPKAVSFDLADREFAKRPKRNPKSPDVPKLRPWCNKPFEPKAPADLQGVKNKRTEEIIQKNKYVSPYCHPAKKQFAFAGKTK